VTFLAVSIGFICSWRRILPDGPGRRTGWWRIWLNRTVVVSRLALCNGIFVAIIAVVQDRSGVAAAMQ